MSNLVEMDGACDCRAVRFRVKLLEGLEFPRRCNCSLCRMRGAVVVSARYGDIEIVEGHDKLSLYQFNTGVAEHQFCSVCGIYTHHRRRSNPDEISVNVACFKDVSPFDFPEVPVMEGVVHVNDRTVGYQAAGFLRYVANKSSD